MRSTCKHGRASFAVVADSPRWIRVGVYQQQTRAARANPQLSLPPSEVQQMMRTQAIAIVTVFFLVGSAHSATSSGSRTGHTFDSAGTTIHYQVQGPDAGEPVLLIHGYRASGSLNWASVMSTLAENYRVITIDNRGHGKSDKPEDPAAYGREMVRDQVRLLDHLGIESAHVAGYSMGGMIALRMLVDHPERVRSAAITGMGWTKDDEETRQRFAAAPPEARPADPVHRAIYVGFGELGISRDHLAAIDVPMITIVGDQDGLFDSSVKPLRAVRPDVPLVLIEGASHMTAPLKPTFRAALLEWLNERSSDEQAAAASTSQP